MERSITAGRVVDAGSVFKERLIPGSRIGEAGELGAGVGKERLNTSGRVEGATGVAKKSKRSI
jgi:hypothetical protein